MTQRCNAPLPIPTTRTHEPQYHGLVRGNIIPKNGPTRPPIQEQTDQELIGEGLPTQLDQTVQLTEPADQVQLILEQQNRTRFMTSREVEEDDVDARVKVDVAQSDFKWQEYKMQLMVLEQ
ncbi:hypothetical protein BFJ63_vAg16400 [Fusarium oxysporum f. sp. narcissi]|uniref:Uncharacterized protein n=1 Tax=Fusarium oxysporum f. sp. narcissi TaxID=451672 RepID=A0A4Q2V944_FUSOX|nr:hypothetical protein BFJ63_vAg16400 [Fusarium oxysporum f. sp. narcissi]